MLPENHIYFGLEKIDAHVHYNLDRTALLNAGSANGFRFLTINTEIGDFESPADQQRIALEVGRIHPDRLHFITTFTTADIGKPGWQDQAIQEIETGWKNGAVAAKIWKNIGMELQDSHGNFIMVSDPAFDPIFSFLEENGIPLAAHQGEPKNCWLPLDKMTVTSDREYFTRNPKYHMHLHSHYPSYEELLQSRDRVLEKYPNLRFIGLHLASLEWSVDNIADWLVKHPNAGVDLAERVCHLQHQAVRTPGKVKEFIETFQDRIIYGSDQIDAEATIPADEIIQTIEKKWQNEFRFFSDDTVQTAWNVTKPFKGLGLSEKVLKKIFHDNAIRYYPRLKNNDSGHDPGLLN